MGRVRGEDIELAQNPLTLTTLSSSFARSFVTLFNHIEQDKEKIGVGSYGISVTTLEEVFIRVGKGVEDQQYQELMGERRKSGAAPQEEEEKEEKEVEEEPLVRKSSQMEIQQAFLSSRTGKVNEGKVFLIHTKALLKKRMIYGMRDKKSFCFQLVIPTLLVLLGMVLLTIRENDEQGDLQVSERCCWRDTRTKTNFYPPQYASFRFVSYSHLLLSA